MAYLIDLSLWPMPVCNDAWKQLTSPALQMPVYRDMVKDLNDLIQKTPTNPPIKWSDRFQPESDLNTAALATLADIKSQLGMVLVQSGDVVPDAAAGPVWVPTSSGHLIIWSLKVLSPAGNDVIRTIQQDFAYAVVVHAHCRTL